MKQVLLALLLIPWGCAPAPDPAIVILGATLLNPGMDSVAPSAVVVSGTRVQRIGTQAETPIPAGSEKLAAWNKFVTADPPSAKLEPGVTANLLLFASDPRANPAPRPERTMKEGQWTR
ncbi:MAG: hypothetical protein FJW39_06425 [Acidobacteria bacterium]|nr:hypothetical protein [Acidobacteriota bacterium]